VPRILCDISIFLVIAAVFFFFLQSLKSEIVPICVSRFVITIDLAKELDSEYLIFVSQYYSFGVSVERISREILVFVS
jgi:hypothetical protein